MVATRSLWGFTLIKEVATSVWVGAENESQERKEDLKGEG